MFVQAHTRLSWPLDHYYKSQKSEVCTLYINSQKHSKNFFNIQIGLSVMDIQYNNGRTLVVSSMVSFQVYYSTNVGRFITSMENL
jgi:hypothetical protein